MAKLTTGRIAFLGGLGLGAGIVHALETRPQARHFGDGGPLAGRPRRGPRPERAWPDEVVHARVRAAVARAASHPHAIDVQVERGTVALSGPVLRDEVSDVLRRVGRVAGVRAVDNRLEPHVSGRDEPRLAGRRRVTEPPLEREVWPRSWRLAAGAAGAVLGTCGAALLRDRHVRSGLVVTAAGAALATRAVTNRSLARMLRLGAYRRVVDLRKTVLIRAPVSDVFRFWAQVENFPLFMEHVLEVSVDPRDGRRSYWHVRGPAGMPIRWDAEVTRLVPDALFAWKTLPGSQLEHAGAVHFEELGPEYTWLQVRMVYVPPAGALGHLVATVLGGDPEKRVEEDLVRLKSLLEDLHTLAPSVEAAPEASPAKTPPPPPRPRAMS